MLGEVSEASWGELDRHLRKLERSAAAGRKEQLQHRLQTGMIAWDEHGIEEYQRTKPERMRIDEPKTPYHVPEAEAAAAAAEDAAADAEALAQALRAQQHKDEHGNSGSSKGSSDGEDEDSERQRARKAAFEARRKQHYNEFHVVKALRQQRTISASASSSSSSSSPSSSPRSPTQ